MGANKKKYVNELRYVGGVPDQCKCYCGKINKTDEVVRWHWHAEFEFFCVKQGSVDSLFTNDRVTLVSGDAILMNSGKLHAGASNTENAVIAFMLVSPAVFLPINGSLFAKYVEPIMNSKTSYFVFRHDDENHKRILSLLNEIFELFESKDLTAEILVAAKTLEIWSEIYRLNKPTLSVSQRRSVLQQRLKTMLTYIDQHFEEKITLDMIATDALISKTEVLRCFRCYLKTTPVNYINEVRLQKADNLLRTTDNKISEIAYSVGFENLSYFNRVYKTKFGITPNERRKNNKTTLPDSDEQPFEAAYK